MEEENENESDTVHGVGFPLTFFWEELQELIKEHTLTGIEGNDLDLDDENDIHCEACTLPIFATAYKTKGTYQNFLHECCSDLVEILHNHPLHSVQPLRLIKSLTKADTCYSCKKECRMEEGGWFYRCDAAFCKFILHIYCAMTVKILHRGHQHELAFIHKRESQFACGACGLEGKGDCYWCSFCDFYMHRDCAALPNAILHEKHDDVIQGQQHPLSLTYNLPKGSLKFVKFNKCSICDESLSLFESGVYFCTRCTYAAHIKCATSPGCSFQTASSREIAHDLFHFPMKNEYANLMQNLLERKGSSSATKTISHEHKVIFHDNFDDVESYDQLSTLCNVCTRPISLPFYSCPECSDFYFHQFCTTLPRDLHSTMHFQFNEECRDQALILSYMIPSPTSIFPTFNCKGCEKKCNGPAYRCEDCELVLDVKCAYLPEVITYKLHGKSHILLLSYNASSKDYCRFCYKMVSNLFYECCSCLNFRLHAACALSPMSLSLKYDRHPLMLTPSRPSTLYDDDDEDFCEICEKGMTTGAQTWFYSCEKCHTSYHLNCIPSVGMLANIKFGRTVSVPHRHGCPLTPIQMLTSYSYTCGHCQEAIEGRSEGVEDIAFECTKCGYWLHSWCADLRSIRRI